MYDEQNCHGKVLNGHPLLHTVCSKDIVDLVGPVQMNSPVDLETDTLGVSRMIWFSKMNGTETIWARVDEETEE